MVIYIPVAKLHPAEINPRYASDPAIKRLQKSIDTPQGKRFFEKRPLLVNRRIWQDGKLVIYGGNQRFYAAKLCGWAEVPCDVDEITSDEERERMIKDNLTIGEWDADLLLKHFDVGILENWGIDFAQIETSKFEDDEKNIPVGLPQNPQAGINHVYQLGPHRLLCGDSTNPVLIKKLFEGSGNADLCLTDPPYSVNYKSRKNNPTQTLQSYKDPADALELLTAFLQCMPAKSLILTYTDRQLHAYVHAIESIGFETLDVLIWKKQKFAFHPGARYQPQHELIFLARKKGVRFYSNTLPNQSTVLEFDCSGSNDFHPTQRPPKLWDLLLRNHSGRGQLVYDPFLGSGTTLIECEKLGRKCFGIEISPFFCDVIIERFCALTNEKKEFIYENAVPL